MMPYVLLLAAAGALGFGLCEYKPTKQKEVICVTAITAMMCLMAVCRGETVGVDYGFIYRDLFLLFDKQGFDYLLSSANSYRTEPLYVLLNMLIGFITDSPMVCFAVLSVLIIVLRSIFIVKYSSKPWISLYFYISFGFFSYALCTMRQELAISVAMFALPFAMNRKPLPYFAIILAAGLIHNSLLLLLPLYWLVLIPPTKKWAVGMLVGKITSTPDD